MRGVSLLATIVLVLLPTGAFGQGKPNPSPPAGPNATPTGFVVVDSSGQVVGRLSDPGHAVLNVDGISVMVNADPTGISGAGSRLYYTSADCTGQPYLIASGFFAPSAILGNDDFTVRQSYYGVPPAVMLTVASSAFALPPTTHCFSPGGTFPLLPAVPLDVSGFSLALSVR
jgi:hypothetical protein